MTNIQAHSWFSHIYTLNIEHQKFRLLTKLVNCENQNAPQTHTQRRGERGKIRILYKLKLSPFCKNNKQLPFVCKLASSVNPYRRSNNAAYLFLLCEYIPFQYQSDRGYKLHKTMCIYKIKHCAESVANNRIAFMRSEYISPF